MARSTAGKADAMPAPIEFYFDFSSPYAYLASERIEDLAARHGRAVDFKPTLLGVIFKTSGQRPLTEVPLKGDYSRHDFARSARFAGIPFRMPEPFPVSSVGAARGVVWLRQADPARVQAFVHAAFRAFFVDGRNISDPEVLASVFRQAGIDPATAAQATSAPQVKDALKAMVDESVARGVFGAPFMFVDGEPFWGNDRLAQIDRWLSQGPF
jgi:2-hydroxychromene-2-carboxylate isomerase